MWRASGEPGARARPRGFSVLEVLVATALILLVNLNRAPACRPINWRSNRRP